jgi:hypothetical protein
MSKRGACAPYPRCRGTGVFINLENLGEHVAIRTPSVAAKLRHMARYAALATLTTFALVELIGIEPMT